MIGALPIREQPTYPPESTIGLADVIFVGLIAALLLVIATAIVTRRLMMRAQRLAVDENRARAAMERLCVHGWRAQFTLYGRGTTPDEAPGEPGENRVRVEWSELDDTGQEPAVIRRLWSRTLSGGLGAMVDDRRLDAQLEEIERAAAPHEPGTSED